MKQLTVVSIIAPGPLAGAEKVALAGIKELSTRIDGHLIVVKEKRSPQFAQNFIAELKGYSINIHEIEAKSAFDLGLFFRFFFLLKKLKNENERFVIHTHDYKSLIYNLFALFKYSVVHTHHGNTGHTLKVYFYELMALCLMNFCKGVVAVSERMFKDLKHSLRWTKEIVYVPNILTFSPELKNHSDSRECNEKAKLKLLFAGRLSPEKGLFDLLETYEGLPPDQYSLTIIGDGVQAGELRNYLEDKQNLSITYLGHQSHVANFLRDCDFLILPSHTEGLPLIILEAAALGVPILASDVGGVSEVVKNGLNGLLFKPQDINSQRNALIEAYRSKKHLAEKAQEKAPFIWENYSSSAWAQRTLNLYEMIL